MNLRREAIGRECQIRLEGICNTEPCCLAHFRLSGISGMGMKSPDQIGAFSCDSCHKVVDTNKAVEVQLDFAKGVFRTQSILIKEGKF